MSKECEIEDDYDQEIKRVDKAIVALGKEMEDLLYKRHGLVAKKCGVDVLELMDYIVKNKSDKVHKGIVDVIENIVKQRHEKNDEDIK